LLNRDSILSLLSGIAAGGASGFLGIGGGVVLVPALTQLLKVPQHVAHGTSLAIIPFIALSGAIVYFLQGYIDWILVAELAGGSIIGVVIGAKLMMKVSERRLRQGFGIFLLVLGILMLLGWS
jgi:hypothetical protein